MYTLKPDAQNEILILHKDGKPLFCPFKPTLLIPGKLQNQLVMQREPCGTQCALFAKTGNKEIKQQCSTAAPFITVEEEKTTLLKKL